MNNMTLRMFAGAMLLLAAGASCTKGGQPADTGIRFNASLPSAVTRVAYSGAGSTDENGQLVHERIDWTDGDLISIYSPQALAMDGTTHTVSYRMEDPVASEDGLTGLATVRQTADGPLFWANWNEHAFYAMFPSPSMEGVETGVAFSDGLFTGVIPVEQTVERQSSVSHVYLPEMRLAYMLAQANATPNVNSVDLCFLPKFTAYEFEISPGENLSVTLRSFSLKSTTGFLTGAYSIGTDGYAATTTGVANASVSGGGKEITLDFTRMPGGGLVMEYEHPVTFTVLALPQTHSGLTLSFTGDEIGTKTLKLKESGADISFAPYCKHRIYGMIFPAVLDVPAYSDDDIIWTGRYSSAYYSDDAISWEHLSDDFDGDVPGGDPVNWTDPDMTDIDGIDAGDNVNWTGDPGLCGPFAGLYMTRGYLTLTGGVLSIGEENPMEILRHYGNDVMTGSTPRCYLLPAEVSGAAVGGLSLPTAAQWVDMMGLSTPVRAGATVNGEAGRHYAKVTVDLFGTPYAAFSPAGDGTVKGLLLFPDGAVINRSEISVCDTPDDDFMTNMIAYSRLISICTGADACAFLPCAGKYDGTVWADGGDAGAYWTSAAGQIGFDSGSIGLGSAGQAIPARMVRATN